jgi:hypothetical protein
MRTAFKHHSATLTNEKQASAVPHIPPKRRKQSLEAAFLVSSHDGDTL